MANIYAKQAAKKVPQSEALPGQTQNLAGGFSYEVDDWKRLRRFLVLGTEGGTYYADERTLTLENAAIVERCVQKDGARAVNEIVTVSVNGLAPKNDPAVFALALASVKGDVATRGKALACVKDVCRTGTHLFQFAAAREAVGGGWGRGARRAVGSWYLDRSVDSLVRQCLKYQQRDGWSHRDLLRLAHPDAELAQAKALLRDEVVDVEARAKKRDQYAAVFDAVCAPDGGERLGPSKAVKDSTVVVGFGAGAQVNRETKVRGTGGGWARIATFSRLAEGWLKAKNLAAAVEAAPGASSTVAEMARLVMDYKLERELVPSEYLNKAEVQEAMLPNLGFTALIRNLGNMGRSGFLKPLSAGERAVLARLSDFVALKESRVHPFQLLLAARTYGSGKGFRSQGEGWTVCPRVVDALDEAFYASFANVEPTGKRHLLGVDVSGSMEYQVAGSPVSCAEAAAAMAMVTARTEPEYHIVGFSTQVVDLGISAKDRLGDVLKKTTRCNFGGTDCAAAIKWAVDRKIEVDAFVVYTDSETWAGDEHASKAIVRYRKESGLKSKLAVVAFTGNRHSVADQSDHGSMDFVGLDASLPQALAAFVVE